MEPMLLVANALQILTPFFRKAGGKFAEKIGEDVWSWLKKSFPNDSLKPAPNGDGEGELQSVLLHLINSNADFKIRLEGIIKEAQSNLSAHNELHVENHDSVEKQININTYTGNISM